MENPRRDDGPSLPGSDLASLILLRANIPEAWFTQFYSFPSFFLTTSTVEYLNMVQSGLSLHHQHHQHHQQHQLQPQQQQQPQHHNLLNLSWFLWSWRLNTTSQFVREEDSGVMFWKSVLMLLKTTMTMKILNILTNVKCYKIYWVSSDKFVNPLQRLKHPQHHQQQQARQQHQKALAKNAERHWQYY